LIQVWRICRAEVASEAFSGRGAAEFPGRWNSKGTHVVYCAQSLSLAALEYLVNLDEYEVPASLVAIPCEIPGDIARHALEHLPSDWAKPKAPPSTQRLGSDWVVSCRSAVLSVPSAVIPSERNYLLNPVHAKFKRIRIGEPEPFYFDPRLRK